MLEVDLIRWMVALEKIPLNRGMILLTRLGDGWLWGGIGIWLFSLNTPTSRRALWAEVLAGITASLIFVLTKRITGRPRPCEGRTDLRPIISAPDYYSFPSGHSINAFAISTAIDPYIPDPLGYGLLVIAFGIALSRVYLRLHYPTDVLVGSFLGFLIGGTVGFLI